MSDPKTTDMDDAYANGAYIDGAEKYPTKWAEAAAEFRANTPCELDIVYGRRAREKYDLFFPEGPPKGLFVFVHGGYWLDFDKSTWSHLAQGAVQNGYAAMVPSYELCPHRYITEITRGVGRAINHAAVRIEGPIVLSGHSAGGHLVARQICQDGPLDSSVAKRVARVVGISGLYDLEPLMRTGMNENLRINEVEAVGESPVRKRPLDHATFIAWVGSQERPEFRRQSRAICDAWTGAKAFHVEDEGKHHFDVIDGLADPDSPLTKAALGL